MRIELLHLLEGANKAKGLAVVIDVFRAFSLECYLFDRGVERIYAVGTAEEAYRRKEAYPDYVLVGERKGIMLPGFDFGNSPSQTEHASLVGKTVVHTTSAGTQGLVAASAAGADEIITGSLVNASAIADYIRKKNPEHVSLVCMGVGGRYPAPEDELCGRYIQSLLTGESLDMVKELIAVINSPISSRFFEKKWQSVFPVKDLLMCIDLDKFPFICKVNKVTEDVFEIHKDSL
jgi:2-phosphosulfolactate phosphatase